MIQPMRPVNGQLGMQGKSLCCLLHGNPFLYKKEQTELTLRTDFWETLPCAFPLQNEAVGIVSSEVSARFSPSVVELPHLAP